MKGMDSVEEAARHALAHLPSYAVDGYLHGMFKTDDAIQRVEEQGVVEKERVVEETKAAPLDLHTGGVFASVADDRDWSLLRNSDNLDVFLKRAKVQSPDLYNLVLKNQIEFLDLVWRDK